MPSLRPRPRPGAHLSPGVTAAAAALWVTALLAAGCSAPGSPDGGPPRISPEPRPDVAAAMVEGRGGEGDRLNACELLDLSAGRVIALTGADMPPAEPTGSGDLGLLCIYGGPGSPERYELQLAEAEEEAEADSDTGAEAGSEAGTTTATPTSTTTSSAAPEYDTDGVPDTVAAGVIKPRGGPQKALAGQPAMLGARYACSEIRGEEAASVVGGPPAAAGAPPVVDPDLGTAYLDCVAGPTGGGVEVHTIFIADNDLWHVTLIKPETPRSPAAESAALAGLHRLAAQILA